MSFTSELLKRAKDENGRVPTWMISREIQGDRIHVYVGDRHLLVPLSLFGNIPVVENWIYQARAKVGALEPLDLIIEKPLIRPPRKSA